MFDYVRKSWPNLGKGDSGKKEGGSSSNSEVTDAAEDRDVVDAAEKIATTMRAAGLADNDYFTDTWLKKIWGEIWDKTFPKEKPKFGLPWFEYRWRLLDDKLPLGRQEYYLHIPMSIALELQSQGDFQRALSWYKKIFDFERELLSPNIEKLLSSNSATAREDNGQTWLTDTLNPHLLAKTRKDTTLRFILTSIIRCLLDYAEAEFTADTAESLGRARELYLTAERLLNREEVKQNLLDCSAETEKLIREVGEYNTYIQDFPQIVADIIIDLGPQIPPDRYAGALDKLKVEIKGLTNEADIRKKTKEVFKKHIDEKKRLATKEPVVLAKRIDNIAEKQKKVLNTQLTSRAFSSLHHLQPASFFLPANSTAAPSIISNWATHGDLTEAVKVPGIVFEFCIPPNPILLGLGIRTKVGLFKLNNCMNIAGMHRQTPIYAAPTDTRSGLPTGDNIGSILRRPQARRQSTQYRYKVLVERSRQLVGIAQQMEASYLSFLEKLDQEKYTLLQAKQGLELSKNNVELHKRREAEAKHGKELAELQELRSKFIRDHYGKLIDSGWMGFEHAAFWTLFAGAATQSVGAIVGGISGGISLSTAIGAATAPSGPGSLTAAAAAGAIGSALGSISGAIATGGGGLSTFSSWFSMWASFERRQQEWEYQKNLTEQHDLKIAKQQVTLAEDRRKIVKQEQAIAQLSSENAADVVNFLTNKFTSAALYNWMSRVIGDIYREFLQQATAMAKTAEIQLAFERQETSPSFILSDYWSVTAGERSWHPDDGDNQDRRGMTGSARLLRDIYRMDQHAFSTDQRKLQMSKTISLAMLDPVAFQQFKQTGTLPFHTTLKQFDHDFPGHYLRLIKRVRTSVIALIPPTQGIKAMLSNSGISQVVVGTQNGNQFEQQSIQREPESVALTAAINDSGVFELLEQPEMLLPFEGLGVQTSWEFLLPKPANAFNFNTIADVLITIEYTALANSCYRKQVIGELDNSISAERPFSFRHQFADAWYDLHNTDSMSNSQQQPLSVTFTTRPEDFPPNVNELSIEHITLYFAGKADLEQGISLDLRFKGLHDRSMVGGAAVTSNKGLVSTRQSGSGAWMPIKGKSPVGEWTLTLEDSEDIRNLFKGGLIEDILFVITFRGQNSSWPEQVNYPDREQNIA
ncbi:MAG: hypothetical protein Q3M24_18125 [Candidatus Electrothrix aestuarii]|uniref:Tc toxin complex TcA C-terminal TcB-binding domain-containing protein n=1 Tax=Candidatus Electrothrix aestuarii TaxID=3062594 RepID=A0AAU8LTK2_9BACT|nr:hypothetical protein [Candidatus Electrothrix aestuarii]